MRILAAFVGGWGHAEPLLAIVHEAARRGHHVTFAGQAAIVPRLHALGFDAHVVGPDTVGPKRRPLVAVDREHERFVVRKHFAGSMARERLGPLHEVAVATRADVVVCDEMDVAAMLVADQLRLPRISVSVLAAGLLAGPDVVGDSIGVLRVELGLPEVPIRTVLDGHGVIVPAPPGFRSPHAHLPDSAIHVRPPIVDGATAHREGRRRMVYVTLGTIFNVESGDLFTRLGDAARRLADDDSLEVIVSVGPYVDPAEVLGHGRALPANVSVVAHADQADVLPQCVAVVCHGGSGTVIAALALGVPLVLIPMGADQPDNGDRCEQLGVGVVLDAVTCTADDVVSAVRRVTADPAFAESAARIARACMDLPSSAVAVDHLEQIVAAKIRGTPGTSTRRRSTR